MSVCFANGYHLYNEYAYTCALRIYEYISYFYIKAFVDHEKKGNFQIFFFFGLCEILADTQLRCCAQGAIRKKSINDTHTGSCVSAVCLSMVRLSALYFAMPLASTNLARIQWIQRVRERERERQ